MSISVIIPAYNAENTIAECVESIVKELGGMKLEIIIVNDGSGDHTFDICKKLQEKYDCVHVIDKKNGGVSSARNCGIRHAGNDWIMFVDSDDGLVNNAGRYVRGNIEEDIVIYSYTRSEGDFERNPEEFCIHTDILKRMVLNRGRYIRKISKLGYIDSILNWSCWGRLYRKKIIVENGCSFPENITHGEDLVFNYQFYSAAKSARCVAVPFYYYRLNRDSVSRTFNPRRLENTRALLNELKTINPAVENDPDYLMFVYNRLFACCKRYFSFENKELSRKEKCDGLEQLCKGSDFRKCLEIHAFWDLSTGVRTRICAWIVLKLLKHQKYDLVVNLFNHKRRG